MTALAVADLARAGAGLNRQETSFFDPLPEIAALRLDDLDGGRVFSYGLDHSPAFREVLGRGGARPHADGPLPAPADPRALRERDRPRSRLA